MKLMNCQCGIVKPTVILIFLVSSGALARDPGIGVLYFDEHGPESSNFQTDSMDVFFAPHDSSSRIAIWLQEVLPNHGGYRNQINHLPPKAITNFVEYGYEISGIPFDSTDASGRWFRVIFGISGEEVPLRGWIRHNRPSNDVLFWSEELPKHPLFFYPRQDDPEFFNGPGGDRVIFNFEKFQSQRKGSRKYDYIMHPLKTEGTWLQVRVVTPSDYCMFPENPRVGVFWIRFLDDKGRPLVFYYTRGC